MKEYIKGANPYMPLWEHVPDGEPRVFEYNGEKRVYLYGSHDTLKNQYCGPDYVVWSAPVDDLTNWTCHGVSYTTHYDGILFAPDVVQKGDTFYLYAAEKNGGLITVASSKTPWGPFENPVETELGFDPGVMVDDDGRVYAYWGGCAAPCYVAELEDDMATIKKDTLVANPMGHSTCPWDPKDDGHISLKDAFFEASSPRKVLGKYVYIYSKRYEVPVPELGVFGPNNGFLSYMYSDSPLGPFIPGGDISFNGGEILKDAAGVGTMTYQWGNNHGSIMEVNGKWYVFYHRQTGVNEYSRQAMIEPIDVALGKDGRLYIGDVKYLAGEPVSSRPVEMTSQGAQVNGLDAYKWISAGYACHIYGSKLRAYIEPRYEQTEDVSTPIVGITSGTTVGFRYLQFGNNAPSSVSVVLDPSRSRASASVDGQNEAGQKEAKQNQTNSNLTVNVRLDSYQGRIVASLPFTGSETEKTAALTTGIVGKHAVYFEFVSEQEGEIAALDRVTFDR